METPEKSEKQGATAEASEASEMTDAAEKAYEGPDQAETRPETPEKSNKMGMIVEMPWEPEQSKIQEESVRESEPAGKEPKKKRKGRKKLIRRIIWIAVLLVILGGAGFVIYNKLQSDYTITYDPYTASIGSISNSLSFSGTMQLVNSETYTASSDAKVREVYAKVGDKVSSGDKLIRLSTGDTLVAEFDGTVMAMECAKGDEVKSGDTLATVADFDHMKVSVRVGESDISSVHVGQSCRVAVSSAQANFDATIDKIDYVSYSGNNVAYYTTTVNVDTSKTEQIYPGMQATVTVPLEEAANVVVLKMDALSTARDNSAYVYKEAEDGTMTQTPVTVGVSNGNYVEIRSGITDGETVYKIAEKEETQSGLAGLFAGLFTRQQVNRPSSGGFSRSGGGSGDMPANFSFGSGSGGSGFPGGGSRGN